MHKQENLEEAVLTYSILFPSFDEEKISNYFLIATGGICALVWFH